ncbi:DUF3923 family protein [Leuconostoc citreum]
MKHKKWFIFNILSSVLFLVVSIFLWFRHVDGSGAIMNTKLQLLNLAIWFIFFTIMVLVEFIIIRISKHVNQ